jgi:hypothetical protein
MEIDSREVSMGSTEPLMSTIDSELALPVPAETIAQASTSRLNEVATKPLKTPDPPLPLSELSLRRLTRIKEGDSVLLRLPSDAVKAVVASPDG